MDLAKYQKLKPILDEVDKRLLAEKDAVLAADWRNADNIELWVENHARGSWTVENVMAAVDALHEQKLVVWLRSPAPPVVKTPLEIAREQGMKDEAKMRKDYLESIRPTQTLEITRVAQARLDEAKAESLAKELKTLVSQIEYEISNYNVGHPSGSVDYSRTESGRDKLRAVRDQHRRTTIAEAKVALSAVRSEKSKLP
jgi:hypothetical protein